MSPDGQASADDEARRRPRFLIRPRVPATFSGIPVSVLDLSATGLRLEHATPMRINSRVSIQLETEENHAHLTVHGHVVWSRLSRVTDQNGKLLYHSGVRLDDVPDSVAGLFGRVIHLFGERDSQSILTQRSVLAARASSRAAQGSAVTSTAAATQPPAVLISADDARAIRKAQEALHNDPQTAQQYYNRARYSIANHRTYEAAQGMCHYPREVIVIWEYLGGRIELDAILKVVESKPA